MVISDPTFVEQSPRHGRNFALVKHVRVRHARGYVLVSVGLQTDDLGRYRVKSGYLIKEEDVQARRLKGYMHPLKR